MAWRRREEELPKTFERRKYFLRPLLCHMPLAAERKGREGGFLANFKRVDEEERQESDALCKSGMRLNSPNMFLYSLVSFFARVFCTHENKNASSNRGQK